METKLDSTPPCYVFDASSLIELERRRNGKGLKDMPDRPGRWLVVPLKVARQMNSKGAPIETRAWLASGQAAVFTCDDERRQFMKIRVQEKLLEDADIQGVVIAYHRKCTYVVDEGKARMVAKTLGVRCISARHFLSEVQPFLL